MHVFGKLLDASVYWYDGNQILTAYANVLKVTKHYLAVDRTSLQSTKSINVISNIIRFLINTIKMDAVC